MLGGPKSGISKPLSLVRTAELAARKKDGSCDAAGSHACKKERVGKRLAPLPISLRNPPRPSWASEPRSAPQPTVPHKSGTFERLACMPPNIDRADVCGCMIEHSRSRPEVV